MQFIPRLDRNFLKKNNPQMSIVRFTGMVQDMLDTEYYVSEIGGVQTHFRDYWSESADDFNETNLASKLNERQPLVVVPLPFSSQDGTEKDESEPVIMMEVSNDAEKEASARKRDRDAEMAVMDSNRTEPSKKHRASQPNLVVDNFDCRATDWWPMGSMGSDPNQCAVLAKVCYEQIQGEKSRLRLNDVVELVGVLSFEPVAVVESDTPDNDFFEERLVFPPPSLMPRLHVLTYKTMELEELVPDTNDDDYTTASIVEDRARSIELLSRNLFGGLQSAGEALLMSLLSHAEREQISENVWAPVRTPDETALGCAALRFVLPSAHACKELQRALVSTLKQMVPVVAVMSLSDLGRGLVSPAKTDSGRLMPSALQCPKGSVVVINESDLVAEPKQQTCRETLDAIRCLTARHYVPYRFEGMMRYNFEADYRIVVLSTPQRSTQYLNCSMEMPLPLADFPSSATLPNEALGTLKSFLARCRLRQNGKGNSNICLGRDILQRAQEDFVKRRLEARSKGTEVGEADFHRWLTISRIQARSYGCTSAAPMHWQEALRLDDAMRRKG